MSSASEIVEELETKSQSSVNEVNGESVGEGEGKNLQNRRFSRVKFICHKWIKTSPYSGLPKINNFRQITQETLSFLHDGDILVEALCWTVDHFMRIYDITMGSVMPGEQVGSVIASKNFNFPIRTLVVCSSGWSTLSIINPNEHPVLKVPELGDLPVSLCLDTLGYPGILAYYALFQKCCVKSGDFVLVNCAAMAVGNVLGQIAKIKGCTVIAFCGSSEQSSWVRTLGFDHVFNLQIVRPSSALLIVAPQGVDVYFDCVGSDFTMDVTGSVKPDGTICMFGQVKTYNRTTLKGHWADPYHLVVMKGRQVQYDSLTNHMDFFPQAQKQLLDWIVEGKLQYKEEIFRGFERLPHALAALYDHSRVGKLIILSAAVELL